MSESTASQNSSQDLELFFSQVSKSIAASDISVTVAIMKRATAIAVCMCDKGLVTEYKTSISDIVTAVDRAAEKFVAEVLAVPRPEDGILGEEGLAKESQTDCMWVIDPVGGTYNLTIGSDYWCSALALVMGDANNPDEVVLDAMHRPATGESWVGDPDFPITRVNIDGTVDDLRVTDRPLLEVYAATYLHTTVVNSSEESEVITTESRLDVVFRSAIWHMLGSVSVDMTGITDGRVGAWFQRDVATWGWLPRYAFITDAGGEYTLVRCWKLAGSSGQVAELSEVLRQNFGHDHLLLRRPRPCALTCRRSR